MHIPDFLFVLWGGAGDVNLHRRRQNARNLGRVGDQNRNRAFRGKIPTRVGRDGDLVDDPIVLIGRVALEMQFEREFSVGGAHVA